MKQRRAPISTPTLYRVRLNTADYAYGLGSESL